MFDRDSQRGAQFALEYGFRYKRDAEGEKKDEGQRIVMDAEAEAYAE